MNERQMLDEFNLGFLDLKGNPWNSRELQYSAESISLLKDMYPVIALYNLENNEDVREYIEITNENERAELVSARQVLEWLSRCNDIVIELRNFLYSEIAYANYEYMFKKDFEEAQLVENANRMFEELILLNQNGYDKSVYFKIEDYINEPDYWRGNMSLYKQMTVLIDQMHSIVATGVLRNANTLWGIFLLAAFNNILGADSIDEIQVVWRNEIEGRTSYSHNVNQLYRDIDGKLLKFQQENTKYMLFLAYKDKMSAADFYNKSAVLGLYKAFNSKSEIFRRYFDSGYTNDEEAGQNNSSTGCFSVMKNVNSRETFVAISGTFDNDKYVNAGKEMSDTSAALYYKGLVCELQCLLGVGYKVIDSDDDTLYYFDSRKRVEPISAKQYINSPTPVDKSYGKRMFSCCERKLSSKMRTKEAYDFYVKYPPCTLCERMFKAKNKQSYIRLNYVTAHKDISKKSIKKMDDSALEAVEYYGRYKDFFSLLL